MGPLVLLALQLFIRVRLHDSSATSLALGRHWGGKVVRGGLATDVAVMTVPVRTMSNVRLSSVVECIELGNALGVVIFFFTLAISTLYNWQFFIATSMIVILSC